MTNFEKYENDILRISYEGKSFGLTKDNKIVECDDLHPCVMCKFSKTYGSCCSHKMKWLYEQAKIWTDDEIAFAKLLKKFGVTEVYADCNGPHWKDNNGYHGELPIDAFGELRAGKRVSLDDIIAEGEEV